VGRLIDCDCGEPLRAADDVALARAARAHYNAAHPYRLVTNSQIRALIEAGAREVPDRGGPIAFRAVRP